MADQKVSIAFEAKLDEITSALGQLSNDFKKFSSDTKQQFGAAGDAMGGLVDQVKKLGAAFLTFEGLKRAVETTKDLGVEAIKLASIFGISTTEASQFAVAIEDVHGSVEQVEHAAAFLSRQLRENSDVVKRFGLDINDGNGGLKSQKDLFMDAIKAINEYKAGTDRNIATIALFGRGALELQEVLKLTPQALEEARVKADALGLTLTQQGTVTVMDYRDAMQDVTDVFRGLQKVVGEALMPILTTLGKWFAEIGPAAIAGFKVAVNIVVSAIWGVIVAIQVVTKTAAAMVQSLVVAFVAIGDAINKALHGDFEGAAAALDAGDDQIKNIWHELGQDIIKDATNARDKLADLWNPDKTPAAAPGTGGKKAPIHDKTLMAQLEARLALMRSSFEKEGAARGEFVKFSLQQELEYWQQYVDDPRLNGEERLKLKIKAYDLETQIARRQFVTEIDGLRASEAAYKTNLEAKLALQQEIQKRMERAFPGGGPEVEAERKKTQEILREIQNRDTKVAEEQQKHQAEVQSKQLDSIGADLQHQFNMRQISRAQLLSLQQDLEDRRFDIQRDAVNRQLELEALKPDTDLSKIADLNAQRESLAQDHENKILDIKRQAAEESAKFTIQAQGAVESSFANLISNMALQYKKLSDILWGFVTELESALVRIAAAKIAEKVLGPGGILDLSGVLGSIFGTGTAANPSAALTASATVLTTAGTELTVAGDALFLAADALEAAAATLELAGATSEGGNIIQEAGTIAEFFAADGGPVFPNYSYLVGENGPEIFTPNNPGVIAPNGVMPGGGGGSVTIHVNGDVLDPSGWFDRNKDAMAGALRQASRNFNPATMS